MYIWIVVAVVVLGVACFFAFRRPKCPLCHTRKHVWRAGYPGKFWCRNCSMTLKTWLYHFP
jgi:tRNA(Ile2) C34 agmatinyltransferase TiaS